MIGLIGCAGRFVRVWGDGSARGSIGGLELVKLLLPRGAASERERHQHDGRQNSISRFAPSSSHIGLPSKLRITDVQTIALYRSYSMAAIRCRSSQAQRLSRDAQAGHLWDAIIQPCGSDVNYPSCQSTPYAPDASISRERISTRTALSMQNGFPACIP